MRSRFHLVFVMLVTTIACRQNTGTTPAEWKAWFNATAASIPSWKTAGAVSIEEGQLRTPDGLLVELGGGYRNRNNAGCWAKRDDLSPGAGWRDVCVQRLSPGLLLRADYFLKSAGPKKPDGYHYEDWEVGLVRFGNRRAIVERARVSGGVEGANSQRVTSVLLELGSGEWAILEGRGGDDAAHEEFLAMAGTIRPI
jgi:hypothetical protein